jgi:uncharacterized protein YbaR (Trm112 family)
MSPRMIDEQYLELLRCPLDPARAVKLILEETKLLCSRCRLQFRTREGFASLIVEEATLPEGCSQLSALPCQREGETRKADRGAKD